MITKKVKTFASLQYLNDSYSNMLLKETMAQHINKALTMFLKKRNLQKYYFYIQHNHN